MRRLDRLYKKALQGMKDQEARACLERNVRYMAIWYEAVSHIGCNAKMPEDEEQCRAVYREACCECGHEDEAERFLKWLYGGGDMHGYSIEDGDANRG